MSKQSPPTPTANTEGHPHPHLLQAQKAFGPWPTIIQIVGRPGTGRIGRKTLRN